MFVSSLSTVYVRVPVYGDAADLSALTVEMAIIARGTLPVEADWKTATWLDSNDAALLIGPSSSNIIAAGSYDVYVRVTDPPEVPVMKAGSLVVQD